MPERHEAWAGAGPPWVRGGPPSGRGGPPWLREGPGAGRRFRRVGIAMSSTIVVLLVALLATVVASVLAGNAPAPWITVSVTLVVVGGLIAAGALALAERPGRGWP